MSEIKTKVIKAHKGDKALRVSNCYYRKKLKGVHLIYLELNHSNYDLIGTGSGDNVGPCISLCPTNDVLGSDTDIRFDWGKMEEVEFPEYRGWEVWSAIRSKDTYAITLIKSK